MPEVQTEGIYFYNNLSFLSFLLISSRIRFESFDLVYSSDLSSSSKKTFRYRSKLILYLRGSSSKST